MVQQKASTRRHGYCKENVMKNADMMWYTIENIVILAVICFLVWLTGSAWWVLLVFLMKVVSERKTKNVSSDKQDS